MFRVQALENRKATIRPSNPDTARVGVTDASRRIAAPTRDTLEGTGFKLMQRQILTSDDFKCRKVWTE